MTLSRRTTPGASTPVHLHAAARGAEPDKALFARPTAPFRGAPFWSLNGVIDRDRLLRQLGDFKAMGLGGAHLHSRTGLAIPYLGEEFLAHARASVEECARLGMLLWLYDEDRWPSGFAGGLATREERHRLRYLLFTPRSYAEDPGSLPGPNSRAERWRTGQGRLLARHALRFQEGRLAAARRLAEGDPCPAGHETWYAYLEVCPPTSWYNHQAPLDVLSREAVEHFIAITHDTYAREVGHAFGTTVPAIFTDEPLFTGKTRPMAWDDRGDQWLPWTDNLADTLRAAHGVDILEVLPALFFDGLEGTARTRWCWHDHVTERFREAYAEPIGRWCDAHGIRMTGHLESEQGLASQTARAGECMRFYQPMHLPGIDLLCDAHEFSTLLQARSVTRQEGREGVMSELYGVTNWDFTFAGHKGQGDWQAALGVTLRVHHLAWYSMAGEAKRDYPAAIDAHSPWYKEYPLVEDHFARLNVALARGRARARVAVVHPVESVWPHWGQEDRNGGVLAELEERFQSMIRWLLHGLVDFDFVAESLLPRQRVATDGGVLQVGEARYDAVIVPSLRTMRSTTLAQLERFAADGGRVAFVGEPAPLVDALPSSRAAALATRVARLDSSREAILSWLEPLRELRVRSAATDGGIYGGGAPRLDKLVHQVREDGEERWTFLAETTRGGSLGTAWVELRGDWDAELWDTLAGTTRPLAVTRRDGWSGVTWDVHGCGSVLLRWTPARVDASRAGREASVAAKDLVTGSWEETRALANEVGRLAPPLAVTQEEPNVLVLDLAEGSLDGGAWSAPTEVLRLDNGWRVGLGWGQITSRIAQPWAEPVEPTTHATRLRFTVTLEVPVAGARLAMERADETRVALDGVPVEPVAAGWFVDEDIRAIALPPLAAGVHVIELSAPYGRTRTLERAYLLGDFGVRVEGARAIIEAPRSRWHWGDLGAQGLPFQGGNVTYRCRLDGLGCRMGLRFHAFRAPLLRVRLDGRDVGPVAFPPYEIDLGEVTRGEHVLEITAYGDRFPSFGQFHFPNPPAGFWYGPASWRTEGDSWSDEYQLRPHGVLAAPIVTATR